jgi:hypothetical protein
MKMQLGLNNVFILLFWFTGLLFFSYDIISHNNHCDSVFEFNDQTCHSNRKSEDDFLPCHTFNIWIVEKTIMSLNKDSNEDSFSEIFIKNDCRIQDIKNPCGKIKYSFQHDAAPSFGYLKNTPVRGSPYII